MVVPGSHVDHLLRTFGDDLMIATYPWLILVDIRPAKSDEHWMSQASGLREGATEFQVPVVQPDNAYNILRLEDLKIPEGHEPDGETLKDAFRQINKDTDAWLGVDGKVHSREICAASLAGDNQCGDPVEYEARRLCLRKIAPKTKRVLVTVEEIVLDPDRGHGFISERFAAQIAKEHPHVYRIEERPA
jgi:hypothetical protein